MQVEGARTFAATVKTVRRGPLTFPAAVVFESCVTTTMFACGMSDGDGFRYDADDLQWSQRYTFWPDGTFTIDDDYGVGYGRYEIRGAFVLMTETDEFGRQTSYMLDLAPDGSRLGSMKRL